MGMTRRTPAREPREAVTPLLSDAHEQFCQEYLVDLNATAAYQRVYREASAKSASAAGVRLLGNVRVAKRVSALQVERAQRTRVTQDDVIEELKRIAFSDMRTFAEWGPGGVKLKDGASLPDDAARCVAEVCETVTKDGGSRRFKLHDKVGALAQLGKHLGLFRGNIDLTSSGKPIAKQVLVIGDQRIEF